MDYVVVCLVVLFVSALTLFSGVGLGTVLMPGSLRSEELRAKTHKASTFEKIAM